MKTRLHSLLFFAMILFATSCKFLPERDCECIHEKVLYNTSLLEGYLDKQSYLPGESVRIYMSSYTPEVSIQLYRFRENSSILYTKTCHSATRQSYSTCSFKKGCNWSESDTLNLPSPMASGYYAIRLSNAGKDFFIPFIVRSPQPGKIKLVMLASTNNWQAYNDWGGASFYRFYNDNDANLTRATEVSFNRPNPGNSPMKDKGDLVHSELYIYKWLIAQHFPADALCDEDLHNDSNCLMKYQTVIIPSHSEYWSEEMIRNLKAFQDKGGNILYLGGNAIHWKVTKTRAGLMEVHKDGAKHRMTGENGGKWRDLGKSEVGILGAGADTVGIGTYAPYKVLMPEHWAFAGTGLKAGDLFGTQSLNGGAASGRETDKVGQETPRGALLLAHGINPPFDKAGNSLGGADMVYFELPSGSKVFCAGSIAYGGALSVDTLVSRITRNVLEHFASEK